MYPALLFQINYSLLFDVYFARSSNLITREKRNFLKEAFHVKAAKAYTKRARKTEHRNEHQDWMSR